MRVPFLLFSAALAALVAAGCERPAASAGETPAAAAAAPATPASEAVPVQVVRPERGPISACLAATATLEARRRVDVYAQAAGVLRELAAEEGDVVEAGRLLARLDEDDLRLADEKARVNAEKATADLARNQSMLDQKLIPPERFDEVRFAHLRAQVERREAALALERCRITAPIAGTVIAREVRFGDLVARNARLFSLADLEDLVCKAYVPEKEMTRLAVGQPARVLADAAAGREFAGRVELASPVVDPASGTQKIQIAVANPGGALRPGMFVSLAIVTDVRDNALLLPKKALLFEDNRPSVLAVRDGRATRLPLRLGLAERDRVEVLDGLAADDAVIVVGQNGLREGAAVRVVE